ncbi:translocation/assembly module TamB [Gillisia sp. M10.2A]|uniref:Translocation/assembly module TamB n=1 Tax=Gillisia lutea TaxID=2909668 RepID=A0ABS9EFF1_9FLAO|nr:translocation/assembly module TamB domain-containing protein [Gillisia lutea]MCF4101622.1 translocation/assembly module TamB [Gillisia lutea]
MNSDVNVSVGRVSLSYFGKVKLNEVYVEDHHQDTLLNIEELRTSILGISNLVAGNPRIGNTTAKGFTLKMRRYKGEDSDNLSVLLEKLKTEPTGETKPFELVVSDILIQDGYYSFIDENNTYPEIVILDNLTLKAEQLKVVDDRFTVNINTLQANEGRGLTIDNLSTDFSYSPSQMLLKEFALKTSNSTLNGDISFNYELEDFSDFLNKVKVEAQFNESSISSNDLKCFYQPFGRNQKINIATHFKGTLNNFYLENLRLDGMDRSSVYGKVNIVNAFSNEANSFKLSGDFDNLTTNYYDLINLLPTDLKEILPITLQEFGSLKLQGTTVVTRNTLDANVFINTQLGSAKADVIMGDLGDKLSTTYKGNLVFDNFNIGKLLDNKDLGKTSLNLNIDGKGFTPESLDTKVRGRISRLNFNKYTYSDIRILGTLKNSIYNGNFISNDPNFKLEFNGLVDLSQKVDLYDFEASVTYADLHKLNFITRDTISVFKGDIIMNMQGNNIDNVYGNILLMNTSYQNQNDLYYFDDLNVTSSFDTEGIRTIAVTSPDVINGKVSGTFKVSEVGSLIENSIGSIYTNYRPNTITNNQYMEFDFDIYNKIVEVFYPEITLAPNTFIRGRVESDESEFRLTFKSPKIEAFGNMMKDINIQVDNTNPIYNTFVEADSVATKYFNFSEFSLINVTLRDTLFIRSEFQGGKNNSDVFNLNLYHTINAQNKSVVGIQRSDVKFKDNLWFLNEEGNKNNRVIFSNNFSEIDVDSLVLSHENEMIRLSGKLKDTTYKNFRVEFENVDIGKITPEIDSLDLAGTLNGKLHLLQEKGTYYPNTGLTIDGLTINDNILGKLDIKVDGNGDLTYYNIDATLRNDGFESLNAKGGINTDGENPTIDMYVALRQFNMAAFSPLGGEAIDNIRGFASGDAKVTGSYKNPDIAGKLELEKAGLRIPYLNIDFDFKDNAEVDLTEQKFNFKDIDIVDTKYKTTGVLDGTISHKNFKEWFLDLDVSSDRLVVLDTEAEVDALYYGTAFIDGFASIKGPTDELVIDVNASTEKGTIFKIPLSDTESIGDNSYIHFLSPEEKAARLAGEAIVLPEIKGLELNFDLDITNDAEVEVVVDQTSGSTLRGKGAGNLLIEINTKGKFNMWGDFVVYQGVYNFKYAGLVQKVFQVRSGSSINWDGNPTQAELDVSAIYEVDANPAVLLENPSVNRKIPVEVVILLQGQIAQPDITFNVEFPNVSSSVRSELEYRMNDRASRELQALFLVTQGSFYSEFAIGQNAITGNLVERASSLVNDIFSGDDQKFQVGVNYVQGDRTPDQQTVDRFGLTLSTQISNRVLINGQVGIPVGGVTESVVVGDVEIEFLLNEDGSLRAKVFNRENNIQFIGEEIGFTQGVGLSYSVDFDTFKELIRKILNKEVVKSEAEKEEEESAKSLAPEYIVFPEQ